MSEFNQWDREINKWDQYYSGLSIAGDPEEIRDFGNELLGKLLAILPNGGDILEAGCGGGWQSLVLAQSGKFNVNLLDFSKEALDFSRKIFTEAGLEVNTIHENFAMEGRPEYDLVFNAGVFEHYSFEEQVQLLRGMASRSKKYVLVIVPNRLCYWYWLWRINAASKGLWPYGKEVPVADLSVLFQSSGLHFIGQAFMAASWTESFIKNIPEIDEKLKDLILEIHRQPVIDAYQKSYLVAGLGCVSTEFSVQIPGWEIDPIDEQFDNTTLQSSIADLLAAKVFSDAQYVQNTDLVNSYLADKENLIANLRFDLDNRERRILELEKKNDYLKERIEATAISLQESNTLREQVEAKVEDLSGQVFRLSDEKQREIQILMDEHQSIMDTLVSDHHEEIKSRDEKINSINEQLDRLIYQRAVLQNELEDIHHSRMWKVVQLAWRIRVRLVPSGSQRARVVRATAQKLNGVLDTLRSFPLLRRFNSSSSKPEDKKSESLPEHTLAQPDFMPNYLQKKKDYSTWLSDINNANASDLGKVNRIISKKPYKGIVVYPHAVHWEPVQRPQQLLIEMGKRGYLCFFCDAHQSPLQLTEVAENVYVISGEKYLLFPLQTLCVIVICTWMYQMPFIECLPSRYLWYDLIDKLEIFSFFDDDMVKMHLDVVNTADLVTYSAVKLAEFVKSQRSAHYLPNAARIEDFLRSNEGYVDPKLIEIQSRGKPIIGYYGALAEWVDLKTLRELASLHEEWEFVVIGKSWVDISIIENIPNIHVLGPVPYSELSSYAKSFDVGIIPFFINELTDCVSPLKLFEYCALGIPIVTTPFYEVAQYRESFIKFANNIDEFSEAIKDCLHDDIRSSARIDGPRFAQSNQWLTRIEAVENIIYHSWEGLKCLANFIPSEHMAIMTETFFHYDGQGFYAGGGERYLVDLDKLLGEMDFRTVVYQFGAFPWIRRYGNIEVVSLALRDNYLKTLSPEIINEFNRNFYLINLNRSTANIYSPFYVSWPDAVHPCIGISHGVAWDHFYVKYENGIKYWEANRRIIEASKSCDWLVSVDTNTANWMQTINYDIGHKIKYLPNYVDMNHFYPRAEFRLHRDKIVILYPRRLYRARGFYLVIEVMDEVLERYPNVEMHFVGRGFEEDTRHIRKKAERWGSRVKWYSLTLDDMPGAYQNADISIIPTLYSEGTSLSCLEAMACGNAVIATRIGGLTNLIVNEFNGLLIEPNAKALLEAIVSFLDDPDRLIRFKERGLEVARAFSKQSWEKNWIELLSQFMTQEAIEKPEVISKSKLIDIYYNFSNDLEYILNLLAQLLSNNYLLYVRIDKHNNKFSRKSFHRLQFIDWDEPIDTKPDLIVADVDSGHKLERVDLILKKVVEEDCANITSML